MRGDSQQNIFEEEIFRNVTIECLVKVKTNLVLSLDKNEAKEYKNNPLKTQSHLVKFESELDNF